MGNLPKTLCLISNVVRRRKAIASFLSLSILLSGIASAIIMLHVVVPEHSLHQGASSPAESVHKMHHIDNHAQFVANSAEDMTDDCSASGILCTVHCAASLPASVPNQQVNFFTCHKLAIFVSINYPLRNLSGPFKPPRA